MAQADGRSTCCTTSPPTPATASPSSGLTLDKAGNLYGTTLQGGDGGGFGTVFKLTRGADGRWKETILYDFRH